MSPAWLPTLIQAVFTTLFFTLIGLPFARLAALPAIPPLAIAPTLGWAIAAVLALPVLTITGFGTAQVVLAAALLLAAAALANRRTGPQTAMLPRWQLAPAALAALLPMAAIMPKRVAGGIRLAPPMFDHVKIAVVDAILRQGLPVPDPFAGPPGPGHLAYYYLWHFGAAFIARLTQTGGWQAEASLTFFTAFASLMLILGLIRASGGGRFAALAGILLCFPGSMRTLLVDAVGPDRAGALIPYNSDIGNWLNQASWVPQHMQSACCVIVSLLLMAQLGAAFLWRPALLALTVAAGFESSVWVGGAGFLAAAFLLGLHRLAAIGPQRRLAFLWQTALAAVPAVLLVAPFLIDELAAVRLRHAGAGIVFGAYPVTGPALSAASRPAADLALFWPFLLFLFPAIVPGALISLTRPGAAPLRPELARAAFACLCVAWLCRSTVDNNDLGWRVALPALLAATPMAAVWLGRAHMAARLAVLFFAATGLPQTAIFAADYVLGQRPGNPAGFVRAAAMWQAVRKVTGPAERIANNPDALPHETPWPVNIGWALLSDRPSCYASWETAIAYAPMPRARLLAVNGRSRRIFAGVPVGSDLEDLITQDHCEAVLVTQFDPAWQKPFWTNTGLFRVGADGAGWTLYTAK